MLASPPTSVHPATRWRGRQQVLSYKLSITLTAGRQGLKIFLIFFIGLKKGTFICRRQTIDNRGKKTNTKYSACPVRVSSGTTKTDLHEQIRGKNTCSKSHQGFWSFFPFSQFQWSSIHLQ